MWSASSASPVQPCVGSFPRSKGAPCRVQLRWRALRIAVASVAPWWGSLAPTFRRGSALRASAEQNEGIERKIEGKIEGKIERNRRQCKEANGRLEESEGSEASEETETMEAMGHAMGEKQLWCSVVINLARRPDRRLRLAHVLAEANGEVLARLLRVDAVDGQKLNLENLEENLETKEKLLDYITADALRIAQEAKQIGAHTIVHKDGELVKFHDHLTEGGIACAMSHYKALKTVVEHPTAQWALILEDDIEALVSDVHLKLESIISRLPPNWDALFVGYHGGVLQGTGPGGTDTQQEHTRAEFELQIDEMRAADEPGSFQGSVEPRHDMDIPVLRMYCPLYGLYAWVVRKEAAERLLEEAFPVAGQVDHALSLWLVQKGNSFKVAPRHMLFYSPKSEVALDSDIQTMMHLDQLLADPRHCEEYMNFINTHQSAENPQDEPTGA